MARPREFDCDAALEQALCVFWARGYEGVSIDDLCAAMKLSRSSLYAAFGGKRRLYENALERYEAASVARLTHTLEGAGPVRKGVARIFENLIDDIVRGPGRRGCFIGNCAAELVAVDKRSAARVRRSFDRIEGVFSAALAKGLNAGELGANADIRALARFITSSIQGLRLIGKTGANRAALNDIASYVLRVLH
ncbi:MAG: TetR/AcrR family transcriptional regulator [Betaproteobacteria bacterium]